MDVLQYVDSFMTLAVLLWFLQQHRKDITDLKKSLEVSYKDRLEDVKAVNDEYANLLEKVSVALERITARLQELEARIKD